LRPLPEVLEELVHRDQVASAVRYLTSSTNDKITRTLIRKSGKVYMKRIGYSDVKDFLIDSGRYQMLVTDDRER